MAKHDKRTTTDWQAWITMSALHGEIKAAVVGWVETLLKHCTTTTILMKKIKILHNLKTHVSLVIYKYFVSQDVNICSRISSLLYWLNWQWMLISYSDLYRILHQILHNFNVDIKPFFQHHQENIFTIAIFAQQLASHCTKNSNESQATQL